ncbi:MAG: ABC transporter permease [Candidatus Symbiobacter sp.]|nr:ABC transporter permease [Candidatus Symbiobacter sp.]
MAQPHSNLSPMRRVWKNYGQLASLLILPLAWFAIIYVGSLIALLIYGFYRLDEFSGLVVYELGLDNFLAIFSPAYFAVVMRSFLMAVAVTAASVIMGFPLAWYIVRYTQGWRRLVLFLLVSLPLWSSYLVRLYIWKLLLAKEGIVAWIFTALHLENLLDAILSIPVIGGSSLSFSLIGTFLVFLYMWFPFMVIPMMAALQRIPHNFLEASEDLGGSTWQTLRYIIIPLAVPGIAAGSIFTFSLTLGDYIIPQVIGNSSYFLGQVIYVQQGTSGNIPFAAAFTLVPIVIIGIYLWFVRRLGAFDAI